MQCQSTRPCISERFPSPPSPRPHCADDYPPPVATSPLYGNPHPQPPEASPRPPLVSFSKNPGARLHRHAQRLPLPALTTARCCTAPSPSGSIPRHHWNEVAVKTPAGRRLDDFSSSPSTPNTCDWPEAARSQRSVTVPWEFPRYSAVRCGQVRGAEPALSRGL